MTRKHNSLRARRLSRGGVAAAAAFVLAGSMSAQAAPQGLSTSEPQTGTTQVADGASAATRSTIQRVGVTHPALLSSAGSSSHKLRQLPLLRPPGAAAKASVTPSVQGALKVSGVQPANDPGSLLQSFDGIDAIQNKAAAGFNLEPPDEGLGAGNGYVANFVNVTGGIYRANGRMVAGPFYLNRFFGEPDATNTSDPRVFYDASSRTWFATILEYKFNNRFTALKESHVDIAVSKTADPTRDWNVYRIDTTNLNHSGCPCLADYPILGISRQNVYISTNEFTKDFSGFNGTQLYAVSKSQLVAGSSSVNVVTFQDLSVAGRPAYHVQPANQYGKAPAEWMMNSLSGGAGNHRLGIWAVSNEDSVTSGGGMPSLSVQVIHSESYTPPPVAKTPEGICSLCNGGKGAPTTGKVATDFDAMQETQFINGQLVGALNTGLKIPGDQGTRSGVAWFVVHPSLDGASVSTRTHVARQGYVSVQGEYLLYPHINMTESGAMALTFGLGGPHTYLSAAYSVARNGRSFKIVKLAAAGTGPDNGFTGVDQYGGVGRWGDYSNGQIIPGTNKVWLATQYIPNSGTGYSNWGNRIFKLQLP